MIKRLSIFSIAIVLSCLVVSPVRSQALSLWSDEEMSECRVFTEGPFEPFTVCVFLDPGPEGAFAVEYKLTGPAGHFSTGQILSPVVSGATIGNWFGPPGISAAFTFCQTGLVWVVKLTFMAPDTEPGAYYTELNDNSQFMGVAICPDPRPLRDATLWGAFMFHDHCQPAVRESSWGAIKEMHR